MHYLLQFSQFHPDPLINTLLITRFFFPFEWEMLTDWDYSYSPYTDSAVITMWESIWTSYSSIISIIFVSLYLLTLGLALPQKPKYIKFLNLVAALYILVVLYTLSFEYLSIKFTRFHHPLAMDQLWLQDSLIARNTDTINDFTFNWYPNGSYFSNMFFIIASIAVVLMLWGISDRFYSIENNKIEFLLLVVFIYIGSVFLLNTSDFISALILLECIAFSSYILVGFERKNKFSSSSGIKYLILGSVPGGFFVLGITLLYKNYGSFISYQLENIIFDVYNHCINQRLSVVKPDPLAWNPLPSSLFADPYLYIPSLEIEYDHIFLSAYVAIILIFANLLFKLTAAPLQMWAPSVYGGAPLASTTFLSIFSKLTIVFFSVYLYTTIFYLFSDIANIILISCGLLSIMCGIMGAFSEKLIKRFFVYSSMGHVGFMLLGIGVAGTGLKATINYLLVYVFSAYILWFTLMYLTKKTTHLTNLKGLCINHPILSFILSIAMFSLSGIPPLAGFFVKFEIFYSILDAGYFSILLFLFILTVFSFFYYLRIIKIIYFENTTTFKKNKNQDLIKLRLLAILINVLLFFVIFVTEPFLIMIENSIFWLGQFKN